MKYDILEPFKEYLYSQLPANTARTYYAAVNKLFKDIQFNSLEQIDKDWINEKCREQFKTRNEYSAVKNGLKRLKEYDSMLQLPSEDEFHAVSIKKRNRRKKPPKTIYLKPTQRKINQLSDEKLRYAYRLAMVSGLRVSELADLEASDIEINNEKIFVNVKHGKGGHGGKIECSPDSYLQKKLPEFLVKHKTDEKLFYSEVYLRQRATELGIECHDLRRIFAITTRNALKKEMPVEEANAIVQQRMRHARFSTTKRYLFNRKLKFEYENVKEEGEE